MVRRRRKKSKRIRGLKKANIYYDKRTGKLWAKVGRGRLAYKQVK